MYFSVNHFKHLASGICVLWIISFFFSSCGTTRPYTYMQGQFDTAAMSEVHITDPIIQKGDLMSIVVYSDNPEATKIYNQPVTTFTTGTNSAGTSVTGSIGNGYLVDENGNIQFQGLGQLHIAGLTVGGLKALLNSKLKDTLLNNPYYTIRFLNYRFTMLGEIGHPGIFTIPGDHINLLEAISLGGDLTYFARRDNVLIIREQNGKREWGRIDVTKPDIWQSPFFYLQQNDIVIVEQNRKKSTANDQLTTRNLSIATALISTLAIIYTILK